MANSKRRHLKVLVVITTVSVTMVFVLYNCATEIGTDENNLEWPPVRDYVLFEETKVASNAKETTTRESKRENSMHVYRGRNRSNDSGSDDDLCVKLRTLKGLVPICIHPPERDRMISSYVKDYGTWEEDLLNATGGAFLKHPEMEFLDVGCNIGVYTLFVAQLGHRVVAIDPFKDNLKLLSNSLALARLDENVTLLWNAVSDVHGDVSLNVPDDNIGGAYVSDLKNKLPTQRYNKHRNNGENHSIIRTITIDDLIDVFKGKELFIKMDIEGHEARAIKGARAFLQHVNVRYIQMEWVHHRHHEQGQTIIDILLHNGFLPYIDIDKGIFLDPEKYYMWPENVFWIKR